MHAISLVRSLKRGVCVVALSVIALDSLGAAAAASPTVVKISVSSRSVLVRASVPKGWQSVTLESRASSEAGAWVPRAVTRSARLPSHVTFRVSASLASHSFRVRGEKASTYPLSFFNGRRFFSSRRSALWRSQLGGGDAYALTGDGNLLADAALPPEATAPRRDVEESDLWKIDGDTLYFFNQYRGLQVLDISDPDAPVVSGTLALPAAGDQLYLLRPDSVALLARSGASATASEVVVVEVSGGEPTRAASVPLEGAVVESRLVGSTLYVATHVCLEVAPDTGAGGGVDAIWQRGTALYAINLAVPTAPDVRATLWFAGQASAVMATDRLLFVATPDAAGEGSLVHVVDIGAADGAMWEAALLVTAGRVNDTFKMNLNGDVFTAVSERFDRTAGTASGAWLTVLETYSLADASRPEALGRLELAPGERLFATRFDGSRAYAVTFLQIDPLWIVDLSDPAHPAVVGEIEVPGWSTYIRPLGDRLVTVGVEGGRVAVSLFDVGDPARAGLLSRVLLGEGYSWSEANANEKALSLFSEEGLLLLPFQGYGQDGYVSQVQVIDVNDAALTARGVIGHSCQARRTALHRGRVLSLSGKALLTVDVADRDSPEVMAETELSWSVNHVFEQGAYVLQVESPGVWDTGGRAVVRVAEKARPEAILERFELGAMPVVGQCVREGLLYVLQRQPGATGQEDVAVPNLLLTVIDLGALPSVVRVGQSEAAGGVSGVHYEAVWPKSGLLVWFGRESWFGVCGVTDVLPVAGNPATSADGAEAGAVLDASVGLAWWPWWNRSGVQLLAFDVGVSEAPLLVSNHRFTPLSAWGFSAAFTANGLVYFSHELSERLKVYGGRGRSSDDWRVRSVLDVIDYTDASTPTERASVDVPGQLVGLSGDGSILYLLGAALNGAGGAAAGAHEALHACAYDGLSAYLVASLSLPEAWPRPVRVSDSRVYVGRPPANAGGPSQVEAWCLTDRGVFSRQAVATLPEPASALACFGSLLAVQHGAGAVALFDASKSDTLRPCGRGAVAQAIWLDLNRSTGAPGEGLWIPLDEFGLGRVPAVDE